MHLTSGVLPRKALALARDWVAPGLARLSPSLRTGPVLIDPDQVRLPKPSVFGAEAGVHPPRRRPAAWQDDPILAATQTALLPDQPASVQDGYIRVMPPTRRRVRKPRAREAARDRLRLARPRPAGGAARRPRGRRALERRPGPAPRRRGAPRPRATPRRLRPAAGGRPRPRRRASADLWQPIGPLAVLGGQADQASPASPGGCMDVWVEPTHGLRAYAAAATGGVWYTDDGGAHRGGPSVAGARPTPPRPNVSANPLATGCLWVEWGLNGNIDDPDQGRRLGRHR